MDGQDKVDPRLAIGCSNELDKVINAMSVKHEQQSGWMTGVKPLAFAFVLMVTAAIDVVVAGMFAPAFATELTMGQRIGLILLIILGLIIGYVGLVLFLVGVLRWEQSGDSASNNEDVVALLRSINERLLISDVAKQIAYRDKEFEALKQAIRRDIDHRNFDAAMVLATRISKNYGYLEESEMFREEIIAARTAEVDHKVTESIESLEAILAKHEWEHASREAGRIQRLFPDTPLVKDIHRRVSAAREQHKRDLEREFLTAAERDDVERALDLLKELDRYLTPAEAEPFRETARGVIGKKRDNLGVQFKLAVQDKEWVTAVRSGEQIIKEFPNSRMADEVRSMLDLLRERAAGEQAART